MSAIKSFFGRKLDRMFESVEPESPDIDEWLSKNVAIPSQT
jgi:hypothetical protein